MGVQFPPGAHTPMLEQPQSETEKRMEGQALVERMLDEMLTVRTGSETSRDNVLDAAHDSLPNVTVLITDQFDIWLSDQEHYLIISSNNLSPTAGQFVQGYAGLEGAQVITKYYEPRQDFGNLFHVLKEKSGLSEEEFANACKRAVRKKIAAYLRP